MLKGITRRVFMPACLAIFAISMQAQTKQTTLKGNYVLADEGMGAGGEFASLALLTFTESGAVSGREFTRTASGENWTDVQGNYTFDGTNLGTLTLTQSTQDAEGNDVALSQRYKFAISATGIQAIRADGTGLSKAMMMPASTALNGAFVYSQLNNAESEARLVSINVDSLGNVVGTSVSRDFDSLDVSNVSGNFTTGDNGFGKLTFSSQVTDAEGNVQVMNEVYYVLAGSDRAVAVRTGGGDIGLLVMTR